jgi:hypothetical protein
VLERASDYYAAVKGAPLKAKIPDLLANKEKLEALADLKKDNESLVEQIRYCLTYPFAFEKHDAGVVEKKREKLNEQRQQIEREAKKIIDRWWDLSIKVPSIEPPTGDLPRGSHTLPFPLSSR